MALFRSISIVLAILLYAGWASATVPTVTWRTGKLYVTTNKTAAAEVKLDVRLTRPAATDVTFTFSANRTPYPATPDAEGAVYGAATTPDARPDNEDYGTGKNFTMSTYNVTIPAGKLVPNTQPKLTVVNNPIYDLDRLATITITGVSANARASVNPTLRVNIIDNGPNRKYANVKAGYGALPGATGDGVTVDSAAIQAIIDAVYDDMEVDGNGRKYGGVIEFPSGTYIIQTDPAINPNKGLVAWEGMTFVSKEGAVLKKIDGNYIHDWSTCFWVAAPSALTIHTEGNPIVIKGLKFDGNAPPQIPTDAGDSEADEYYWRYEHRPCIYVDGPTAEQTAGRQRCIIDTCDIHDSISAGIIIDKNQRTTLYNLNVYDNHQTGIQAVYFGGTETILDYRRINSYWTLGALLDPNPPGTEVVFGGDGIRCEGVTQQGATVTITDCKIGVEPVLTSSGPMLSTFMPINIKTGPGEHTVTINNCRIFANTSVWGPDGTMVVNDTTFTGINNGVFFTRNLLTSGTFNNCTFYLRVYPDYGPGTIQEISEIGNFQTTTMTDCTFKAESGNPYNVYGISSPWTFPVVLENPTFISGGSYNTIHCDIIKVGGSLTVTGGTWAGNIAYHLYTPGACTWEATGGTYTTPTFLKYEDYAGTNTDSFTFNSISLSQAYNGYIMGTYSPATMIGTRTITGSPGTNPNTSHYMGFVGDTYTNGTDTWDCTVGGMNDATWVQR